MADLPPAPTYAEPVLTDERTGKPRFNPIWLKWFLDITQTLNEAGGGIIEHNSLNGLQGGQVNEMYHLTAAEEVDLTDAGDSALHFHSTDRARANHTGTQTMSTISDLPTLATTTWTPTLTNVANLDASTAYLSTYLRAGSFVATFGKVDVDPTLAATLTQLGMSLPIASNFANAHECCGVAFASGIAGQGAAILGDTTNDRAQMQWISGDITNQAMYFVFGYRII